MEAQKEHMEPQEEYTYAKKLLGDTTQKGGGRQSWNHRKKVSGGIIYNILQHFRLGEGEQSWNHRKNITYEEDCRGDTALWVGKATDGTHSSCGMEDLGGKGCEVWVTKRRARGGARGARGRGGRSETKSCSPSKRKKTEARCIW